MMNDHLTMGQVVRRAATQYPNRTAIIFEERTYTYAQYNRRVNRAANMLSELGVGFGEHIAVLGRNSVEYLELCHASAKIGAVFGTINWRLASKEISFIVTDGDSKVLVVEADLQDVVAPALDDMPGVIVVVFDGEVTLPGALSYETLTEAASEVEPTADVGSNDDALIMYTSGTTGLPKGAVLTHGNVCWDAISYLTYAAPRPHDALLVGMPMNHVSGLHLQTSAFLVRGLPLVLMRQWDPEEACRLIQKHRVTVATILVTPLQQLLAFDRLEDFDLTSLQVVLTAASKYTHDLPVQAMYRLSLERLLFGYGLTEAAPLATITEFSGEMLALENTLGFPLWYNDVRIVDENDEQVAEGQAGELVIRGPNVFKGYYKRPEVNEVVLRGGWLHTGDLAYVEHNNVFFVDRKKDMIKSGGFNVYSLEVEMAIQSANPELSGVSVIGVPDEKWGEAVVAYVVADSAARPSAEDIIAKTRPYLAGFKLPKQIHFVDEFPTNVSGRYARRCCASGRWPRRRDPRPADHRPGPRLPRNRKVPNLLTRVRDLPVC